MVIYSFVYLYVFIHSFVCLFILSSICLSGCSSIYLFIYLIYLCLSVCLFYLYYYLFTFVFHVKRRLNSTYKNYVHRTPSNIFPKSQVRGETVSILKIKNPLNHVATGDAYGKLTYTSGNTLHNKTWNNGTRLKSLHICEKGQHAPLLTCVCVCV